MKAASIGTRLYYRTEVDGPRFWHQRGFEMAKKLDELSRKTGISKIQLALSWPLHDRRITSLIIGVKSENQLKGNLGVGDWDLPDEIWEEVNKETALDLGHLTQFASPERLQGPVWRRRDLTNGRGVHLQFCDGSVSLAGARRTRLRKL